MMGSMFGIAFLASAAMGWLLLRRMDRRAAAQALRRLGGRPGARREIRRGARALLMQPADEAGGKLASTLLRRLRMKEAAERLLETAALKWSAVGLLHRSVAAFLTGFAAVTLWTGNRSALLSAAGGCAAAVVPIGYARRKARQRVRAFEEQFPDCLEFIARSMRAGHAFSVALEMAHREFSDPLASEFRRAFEEQNLGQPLDIVLRKLSVRVASMDVQFFVSAVLLQKRTGGNLAELLDKLAKLIRDRFKLRARIRAVSAQGLMSGRILASIPVAVGVLMFVVNPEYARFFLEDPTGLLMLSAALGLQAVGYLIIRKIVNIEV
jgi:tight adherence protein B